MKDYQREKVYRWERATMCFFTRRTLDLSDCEALVRLVWRECQIPAPPPRIKDGRGCRHARGSDAMIVLPCWARSRVVTLHELAHAICWARGDNDKHGPAFVATFAELLIWQEGRSRQAIEAELIDSRIDVDWACRTAASVRWGAQRYSEAA